MGRRNDAHVDHLFGSTADLAHLFLLNRTQQLHLHRQRQVSHLVEKQRPSIGRLEESFAVAVGAGKRPFAIAEELALHQILGNRATVLGTNGAARREL